MKEKSANVKFYRAFCPTDTVYSIVDDTPLLVENFMTAYNKLPKNSRGDQQGGDNKRITFSSLII